jgi:hypothetical protein
VNCKNSELLQAMRIEGDLRDVRRFEPSSLGGAAPMPRLVCLVLDHRWEMHGDVDGSERKMCTRCGGVIDIHA